MKHQNLTFSIPEDLKSFLFAQVENRQRSLFISNAIRKALIEEETKYEQMLDAAYEAANRDSDRKEVLREWEATEDLLELCEDDEDWDWLKKKKEKVKGKRG